MPIELSLGEITHRVYFLFVVSVRARNDAQHHTNRQRLTYRRKADAAKLSDPIAIDQLYGERLVLRNVFGRDLAASATRPPERMGAEKHDRSPVPLQQRMPVSFDVS